MVFVTAGKGGGTGTGAAPGDRRDRPRAGRADRRRRHPPVRLRGPQARPTRPSGGIAQLRDKVDTLIIIPNDRLLQVVEKRTSIVDAFRIADDVLRQGVQGITDLITVPGLINLDFADVRTIMRQAGSALMGIGVASGENRAAEAAKAAISSPLLEASVEGATGILLNITGGTDLGLFEVNEAAEIIGSAADRRRQHHLRRRHRRGARRPGAGDGDRDRLRPRPQHARRDAVCDRPAPGAAATAPPGGPGRDAGG